MPDIRDGESDSKPGDFVVYIRLKSDIDSTADNASPITMSQRASRMQRPGNGTCSVVRFMSSEERVMTGRMIAKPIFAQTSEPIMLAGSQ